MKAILVNNMKRERKASGVTQKAIADAVGVTRSSISQWERGDRVPSLKRAFQIADTLMCSVDDLFGINYVADDSK